MFNRINFNGKLIEEGNALFSVENRALKYGDAFFESIRVVHGRIPFLDLHYKRILLAFDLLGYEIPTNYSRNYFEKEIQKTCTKNENFRVRLSFCRANGGLYTPVSDSPIFWIDATETSGTFELNKEGLKLGIYQGHSLSFNLISRLKTANALPYIMAGKFKKRQGWDDCVICSNTGLIAESVSSNIFLVKDGVISSPDLITGCIDGVMRRYLLNTIKDIKLLPILEADLLDADEVFLTNAVKGIQWVASYKQKVYQCEKSKELIKLLNY